MWRESMIFWWECPSENAKMYPKSHMYHKASSKGKDKVIEKKKNLDSGVKSALCPITLWTSEPYRDLWPLENRGQ